MIALAGLAGCVVEGFDSPWIDVALIFGFLLIPVSSVFKCQEGWPRTTMAALTIVLLLLGSFSIWADFSPQHDGGGAYGLFLLGIVASMWIANLLISQRKKY